MHSNGRNGKLSLSTPFLAMVLLAVTIVSCGGQDAAREPAEVPKPAPTATAEAANTKASQARSTPTPYSQSIPSPIVVDSPAPATSTPAATGQPVVAVPTRTPVVAGTPTTLPAPTAEPSLAPNAGIWPTPREIHDRLDWGPFMDRGYFFKRISEGKAIRVYLGPKETRKVTCNPTIGTAFDSSNPTWSDSSHWIWVWAESGETRPGCWGLSKYEDWMNKPLPAEALTVKEIRSRHTIWGEDLKFALDDSARDFSVPPRDHGEGYPRGSRKTLDDGWLMECEDWLLPWAGWTNERGFYTVSLEDEEAQMRERWTEEQVTRKEQSRKRGWYFIIFRSSINQGYCWQVPNHKEIPPHGPCLECQWRSHG